MARYRKIDPRMWGDKRFRGLSQEAKFVWIYLLTGPEATSLPGLLVGGPAHFAEAIGWPLEAFLKAFDEVLREGMAKADWDARLVWIRKSILYNVPESPNVVRSWKDHWDNIPECDLKDEAYRNLKAFIKGLSIGFQKAFGEGVAKPLPNQEQEQEQESPTGCENVASHMVGDSEVNHQARTISVTRTASSTAAEPDPVEDPDPDPNPEPWPMAKTPDEDLVIDTRPAWKLWRNTYKAKIGLPYRSMKGSGDGRIMQMLVENAFDVATEVQDTSRSQIEKILVCWFSRYLDDESEFLSKNKYKLRYLPKEIGTYPAPWEDDDDGSTPSLNPMMPSERKADETEDPSKYTMMPTTLPELVEKLFSGRKVVADE